MFMVSDPKFRPKADLNLSGENIGKIHLHEKLRSDGMEASVSCSTIDVHRPNMVLVLNMYFDFLSSRKVLGVNNSTLSFAKYFVFNCSTVL